MISCNIKDHSVFHSNSEWIGDYISDLENIDYDATKLNDKIYIIESNETYIIDRVEQTYTLLGAGDGTEKYYKDLNKKKYNIGEA